MQKKRNQLKFSQIYQFDYIRFLKPSQAKKSNALKNNNRKHEGKFGFEYQEKL